jgi:hypothetical protein
VNPHQPASSLSLFRCPRARFPLLIYAYTCFFFISNSPASYRCPLGPSHCFNWLLALPASHSSACSTPIVPKPQCFVSRCAALSLPNRWIGTLSFGCLVCKHFGEYSFGEALLSQLPGGLSYCYRCAVGQEQSQLHLALQKRPPTKECQPETLFWF